MAQTRRIKAKKRPEPLSGSGRVTHNPWFHLNSPLEAGHFVPDNGEARRSISAAQLQSAIPFFPEELSPAAPSLRLLKTELLCHSFYSVTVARFFTIVKENPAKEQKFAWNRRKRPRFSTMLKQIGKPGIICVNVLFPKENRPAEMTERFFMQFTCFPGQRPQSPGDWGPRRWNRW